MDHAPGQLRVDLRVGSGGGPLVLCSLGGSCVDM